MGIHVTVLGSGSAGNCTLIETEATAILVDAGLSSRQIVERLRLIDRNLDQMDAILLTHEHSDHTGALDVLNKQRSFPVYANRLTAEAVMNNPECIGLKRISWRIFSTGSPFEIGDFTIESFSVPHDAQEPVGFTIHHGELSVGVLTDLGHVTKLALERVRSVSALVLEANHDVKLLQEDTARPWATKQRIMGRHGHLSNDTAATLAGEIAGDRLRHIFLAHLSRDCNRPDLAHQVVSHTLRQAGATHVSVAVSSQQKPTNTFSL